MDDDEDVLEKTKEAFEAFGYEAECVRDGEKAIKRYRKDKRSKKAFDVVVLDLTISVGWEAKRQSKS